MILLECVQYRSVSDNDVSDIVPKCIGALGRLTGEHREFRSILTRAGHRIFSLGGQGNGVSEAITGAAPISFARNLAAYNGVMSADEFFTMSKKAQPF